MSLDETIGHVESYLRLHKPVATAAPSSFYDGSLRIVFAEKPDVRLMSDLGRELYCSYYSLADVKALKNHANSHSAS